MKYYKIISTLLLGSLLTLASCDDDEKLNLTPYPDNAPSVSISDIKEGEEPVLLATYDADGKLQLDGRITKTFTIRFKASPEDITLNFEPYVKNIPAELISLDKTEEVIKKGYAEATVTVIYSPDVADPSITSPMDFAQKNYAEETYEVGVNVSIKGYQTPESTASKITIKKEAYAANYSIVAEEDNDTEFVREYDGIGIINENPMSYSFKVAFDRPLLEETVVNIVPKNASEALLKALSLSDQTVTIAAGKKESKVVTLSIADDFLLTSSEEELHKLELHAETTAANNVAAGDNVVELTIKKVLKFFEIINPVDPTWVNIDKAEWNASTESNIAGSISTIIDGVGDSYMHSPADVFSFVIDMGKAKTLKGLSLSYFSAYVAKRVEISVSDDNTTWKKQGAIATPQTRSHTFKFFRPTEARYVKFKFEDKYEWTIALTQVYAFE